MRDRATLLIGFAQQTRPLLTSQIPKILLLNLFVGHGRVLPAIAPYGMHSSAICMPISSRRAPKCITKLDTLERQLYRQQLQRMEGLYCACQLTVLRCHADKVNRMTWNEYTGLLQTPWQCAGCRRGKA